MTTLAEHTASLVRYTVWADGRLLDAAQGIDDEQYAQIRDQLAHMLGTQHFWYAKWTGGTRQEPSVESLDRARQEFAASHERLLAYIGALTAEEWDQEGQWWKEWGYENRMKLGESITQVFYHGVQHRSEIAVVLSLWGHSPGDVDYLTFLRVAPAE